MKITQTQLKQIIKEEAIRLKTKMMLESEKAAIEKRLQEIDECYGMEEEGMEEGLGQKFGEFMGSRWSPQQAEQQYNATYARDIAQTAAQLHSDVNTVKAAIIKYMMENGGMPVIGKTAIWNPDTKQFIRQKGVTGNAGFGGGQFSEGKK